MGILTSLEAKLIAALLILGLLALGFWDFHHKAYESGWAAGEAKIQTQFDAFKKDVAVNAATATQKKASTEAAQRTNFDAIAANFEAQTHAQAPTLADSLASAVSAGDFQLRDDVPAAVCPASRSVSAATTRSRAIDAAATQALADRVATAIAVVRIGDAADARERLNDDQIAALQKALMVERATP